FVHAGYDGLSQRPAPLANNLPDPVAVAAAAVPIETVPSAPIGRSVAAMQANRRVDDPGPEIIVRRRDDGDAPAAPKGEISGATAPRRSGDITLNFAGADIRDVAASVLGDMMKLNYVIDPEVKGPINF